MSMTSAIEGEATETPRCGMCATSPCSASTRNASRRVLRDTSKLSASDDSDSREPGATSPSMMR